MKKRRNQLRQKQKQTMTRSQTPPQRSPRAPAPEIGQWLDETIKLDDAYLAQPKTKLDMTYGGELSRFARQLGMQRRWWGLEPDWLLRWRIKRHMVA